MRTHLLVGVVGIRYPLWLDAPHDTHGGHDQLHAAGWTLHRLHDGDVCWLVWGKHAGGKGGGGKHAGVRGGGKHAGGGGGGGVRSQIDSSDSRQIYPTPVFSMGADPSLHF